MNFTDFSLEIQAYMIAVLRYNVNYAVPFCTK